MRMAFHRDGQRLGGRTGMGLLSHAAATSFLIQNGRAADVKVVDTHDGRMQFHCRSWPAASDVKRDALLWKRLNWPNDNVRRCSIWYTSSV